MVQEEADIKLVGIFVEMINPVSVDEAGTTFDAVNDISFAKEKFGEVGAILAGDTGDECNFWLCSHSH